MMILLSDTQDVEASGIREMIKDIIFSDLGLHIQEKVEN